MIRIVRLTFKPEHVSDFEELFEVRKTKIRQADGCEHVELWQDITNANAFYTYSIWQNESYLELYRNSELFKDTWATVKPWFAEKAIAYSVNKKETI